MDKAYKPADFVIADAHNGGQVVTFNLQGNQLASGGWEGRINLWNPVDGSRLLGWQAHNDSVSAIAFINADQKILSASYDGSIALWNKNGNLLQRIPMPAPVTDMVTDEKNKLVVTGHTDGYVRLWRLPVLKMLSEKRLHRGNIRALALHVPTGYVASSGTDGRVFITRDYSNWHELPVPPTDARALAFSPGADILMGGGWFKLFRWDLVHKTLQVIKTEHRGIINSVRYSSDGTYLATISRQTDSAVLFLDPDTGSVLQRFQKHELCGGDIDLSSGERFLATTGDDASVMIWKLGIKATKGAADK